jgi:hypothetical protein
MSGLKPGPISGTKTKTKANTEILRFALNDDGGGYECPGRSEPLRKSVSPSELLRRSGPRPQRRDLGHPNLGLI